MCLHGKLKFISVACLGMGKRWVALGKINLAPHQQARLFISVQGVGKFAFTNPIDGSAVLEYTRLMCNFQPKCTALYRSLSLSLSQVIASVFIFFSKLTSHPTKRTG